MSRKTRFILALLVFAGIAGYRYYHAHPALARVTRAAAAARREMEDRWLLLGPDCSINPDTPERLLHAVGAAVRQATS